MRTTLDLSDEAYSLAKAVARERNIGLGRAVSEIILSFSQPANPLPQNLEFENGFPVVGIGRTVTSEDVRRILDESE